MYSKYSKNVYIEAEYTGSLWTKYNGLSIYNMLLYYIINIIIYIILLCVFVFLVAQSFPNLCKPLNSSLPSSSVYGILQARILEWGAVSYSQGLFLTQRSNQCLLHLLLWQTDSLPLSHLGNLLYKYIWWLIIVYLLYYYCFIIKIKL